MQSFSRNSSTAADTLILLVNWRVEIFIHIRDDYLNICFNFSTPFNSTLAEFKFNIFIVTLIIEFHWFKKFN